MRAFVVVVALTSSAAADTAADCKKGKGQACLELANAENDAAKAFELFKRSCTAKRKVEIACTEVGQRLMDGLGVAKDEKAGFAQWEKSCAANESRACNNLGTSWSDGNQGASGVDHAKAKKLYEKACVLKNGFGCFNLGNVYRLGEGLDPDPKKAIFFFRKSCDFENAKGCTELGIMFYEGKVVTKNVDTAIELFDKSCKLGSDVGCKNLKLLKK
jgi:TPR repeat protein